ncbi:hypothetical protein SAMN02745163_01826 [Clostridium cavendishii DSM 21758]|uniref:Lipoprotein n=1 Tax=Clostridium cavendishii DSM 21758 TaxID=1121302 RepID=A0A1M6IUZ8_9CLOT|nr:hypothetical protein [Clostridium cavendishii]SHJ38311.1 hypothetical protein SAMN02745163_01826 [Clostridium cavendishii DSM 21758]
MKKKLSLLICLLFMSIAFLGCAEDPPTKFERNVKVGNNEVLLESKTAFNGKVNIYIPNDFEKMPEEVMSKISSKDKKPDSMYTDSTQSIILGFIDTGTKTTDSKVGNGDKEFAKLMMSSIYPSMKITNCDVEKVNGKNILKCEYEFSEGNQTLYFYAFGFELDKKFCGGIFFCEPGEKDNYKPVIENVIKSIKIKN